MKFKKVEIQAFRAYDKVENGTFDFVDQETGEIADFISIYAPNGFGKTSFYDAVEWGFTNNINRFLRRPGKNADAAKAERTYKADFGAKDKQHIIRNKYSNPELAGFVKLSTTVSDKVIVNNIPDVRSGEPDFKFKPTDTKKGTEYFQDVLLSQEWIDAFLKEDDSNIRYEKFITYFGDKKLDEYYKTIINLIKANDANIVELRAELKDCQLQLNFEGDRDILAKVNSQINLLGESGFSLRKVDVDFTDKDFLELSDWISAKKLDLEFALDKIDKNEKAVERLLIGTPEEAGIAEYFDSVTKYNQGIKQLDELGKTLKELETARLNQAELKRNINILDILAKDLEELNRVKTNFDHYVSIVFRQSEVTGLLDDENTKLLEMQNRLASSELKLKQAEDRIGVLLAEMESIRQQLVNVDLEAAARADLLAKQDQYTKELQQLEMTVNGKKAEKYALESGLTEITQIQVYYNDHKFSLLPDDIKTKFKSNISNAERLLGDRINIEADMERVEQAIIQQRQLGEELEQFILRGSEIVNNTKGSHCPLCDTEFNSFNELASAISNNSALSKVLQMLVEERAGKSSNLDLINKNVDRELLDLGNHIENSINHITREIRLRDEQLEGLTNQLSELSEKITANNEKLVEWSAKFHGLTPDHFNVNTQAAIDLHVEQLRKVQAEVEELKKNIIDDGNTTNQLIGNKADKEERLKQLRDEPVYMSIVSYINKNFPGKMISMELIDKELSAMQDKQKLAEATKVDLQTWMSKFAGQTISVLIGEANASILERERFNSDLLRILNQFEQTAETLGLKFERQIGFKALDELLKKEMADLQNQTERNRFLIQNLLLLDQLKQNVVPYLNHQKITKKADGIDRRISLLKNKIGKNLASERDRISKFIHEQVESFFYEDLINVLYRKVDPHPEYKKIKFQCDFSNDKPKLNVFVTGENGDNPLVPNLYFSTAQMNILSLSIFLAKALNAEDNDGNRINCIFIDDPIQSMDSINILSTIDLFRSIVIKFKKQIILSTHDENFHNLLRKKIPTSLFNAKYIELETFGTVRMEN